MKNKLCNQWTDENYIFLANLYKITANKSATSLAAEALRDVEKLQRRQYVKELRERSLTEDSVVQKSTDTIKSYNYFKSGHSIDTSEWLLNLKKPP